MKLSSWGAGLASFFAGVILAFVAIVPLLPNNDDPTGGADSTTQQTVLVLGFMLLPALLCLALFATAWRYRDDKKKMWTALLPALLILAVYILVILGGAITNMSVTTA